MRFKKYAYHIQILGQQSNIKYFTFDLYLARICFHNNLVKYKIYISHDIIQRYFTPFVYFFHISRIQRALILPSVLHIPHHIRSLLFQIYQPGLSFRYVFIYKNSRFFVHFVFLILNLYRCIDFTCWLFKLCKKIKYFFD